MSPRTIEANKLIKDERRRLILLTALKIFTRKGFSATKISDISEEVGISYGLVYHYFKSKDDIFIELIEYAVSSVGKVIEDISNTSEEPIKHIQKIITRVLDSVAHKEESSYYYLLIVNALTCEAIPISSAKIIEETMSKLSLLTDIIRKGQQMGQIVEGDPKELAITCFSTVTGLALLKISGAIKEIPSSEIMIRIFK